VARSFFLLLFQRFYSFLGTHLGRPGVRIFFITHPSLYQDENIEIIGIDRDENIEIVSIDEVENEIILII